jgi:TRAP-type C4-dicarboxylate transport system permease small subunit
VTASGGETADRDPGSRLVRLIGHLESAVLVLILATMVVLAGAQIVLRNTTGGGIVWADPALRVLVLWIGMVGALAATRDDKHLTVDAVSRLLSATWKARTRVITDLVTAVVSGLVAWHAARLMIGDKQAGLTAFGEVPVWVCEAILPIGFGLIAMRYVAYVVQHGRTVVRGVDA